MPATPSKHAPTQSRLSHYFSPKSESSTPTRTLDKARKRTRSPIAVSDDEIEEIPSKQPAPKKFKKFSTKETTPVVSSLAEWSFDPESPTKESPQRPKETSDAIKKRRDEFRKRLLQEADPSRTQRAPSLPPSLETAPAPQPNPEAAIEVDSDSDSGFTQLSAMFARKDNSTKGKGKALAKSAASKKAQEIGPSGEPYTPLEKQILQLKADNPGTVLMIEVGYKYRFFGDDAKVAARELGMVAFMDRNFLVAGIPLPRKEVHLKKLLSQGYRVGIVSQTETAALKKVSDNRNAVFTRHVTELYTAATYVDELDSVDDAERYSPPPFLSLIEHSVTSANKTDVQIGLVSLCPSTGDVVWDDFKDNPMRIELETRLAHISPAEILYYKDGLTDATRQLVSFFSRGSTRQSRVEQFENLFEYSAAQSFVTQFYTKQKASARASTRLKSGELLAQMSDLPKRVVIALAHAIKHLSTFNVADALLETNFFSRFSTGKHMVLAASTLANLEIFENSTDHTAHGSLMWILDHTTTKFGARLLKRWVGRPLVDKSALQERVDAVEEIMSNRLDTLVTLRHLLKGLPDLARGLCRIQYGQCTPKELSLLLPSFNRVGCTFEPFGSPAEVGMQSPLLNKIIWQLPSLREPMKELLGAIDLKLTADGKKDIMWTDSDKYPRLLELILVIHTIEAELSQELRDIRKLLRWPSLEWSTVAGEEYLVETRKSDKRPIPDDWQLVSRTKTLERWRPPSVKRKMDELAQRQEALEVESKAAYQSFLAEITQKYYGIMRETINNLAMADCLFSLAQLGMHENYVRPELTDDDEIEIVDGRHPIVEVVRTSPFVPNTVRLGGSFPKNKIITGPNMGGKSSAVRMVALMLVMAQIGSYVPATSAKLGMADCILTRMGSSDDLARGRSTFMIEMTETSEILRNATPRSLVILDELGRGTSTYDGIAIAHAVLEQLVSQTDCRTLFITHYPTVAIDLAKKFPNKVENLHMGYETCPRLDGSREITFLYRLTQGLATESFGVECGRLAGLPESILSEALSKSTQMEEEENNRTKIRMLMKAAQILRKNADTWTPGDIQWLQSLITGFYSNNKYTT